MLYGWTSCLWRIPWFSATTRKRKGGHPNRVRLLILWISFGHAHDVINYTLVQNTPFWQIIIPELESEGTVGRCKFDTFCRSLSALQSKTAKRCQSNQWIVTSVAEEDLQVQVDARVWLQYGRVVVAILQNTWRNVEMLLGITLVVTVTHRTIPRNGARR